MVWLLLLGAVERDDMLKLALSERGLTQLYRLFEAAEQRCELLRRELAEKGEHDAADHQAKRRDDYARMKQRILEALSAAGPPTRLERLIWLLRRLWPPTPSPTPAKAPQRLGGS